MGFFESSTVSLTNLEPTTSTITNNVLTGSTVAGATTSTGVALAIKQDGDSELSIDKKRGASTALTSSIGTSLLLSGCTGLPKDYDEEAQAIDWTAEDTQETHNITDQEELFASLSAENQRRILAGINQKIEAITTEQPTVGRHR